MERRAEDRFAVRVPAIIIPVDEPGRRVEALLSEVSESGMQLIAAEAFCVGVRIVVELESHVALAEIRYSYAHDAKFVLGARKHNMLARLTLDDDANWDETLRALTGVPEISGIVEPEITAHAEPKAVAAKTAPFVVVQEVDQEIVSKIGRDIDNKIGNNKRDDRKIGNEEIEHTIPAALEGPRVDFEHAGIPDRYKVPILTDEEAAALYAKAFPKPGQANKTPEPAAKPEPPPEPAKPGARTFLIVAASVACVFAIAAAGIAWGPLRGQAEGLKEMVAAAVLPGTRGTSDAAPNQAASVNSSTKRHVLIVTRATNWLIACSDTNERYGKLLPPGDKFGFDFLEKAVIRMGNSGATDISLDGKPLGPIGAPGSPRVIMLAPSGFQYVTGLPADGSKDCPAK